MQIQLIPADPSHVEIFLEYRQDPVTIQFNPLQPSSIDALKERLANARSDFADFQTASEFFWFVQHCSEIVGNVSLQNINRMMLTAELGYGVMPSARGKGLASAAVHAITEAAFTRSPLRRLVALVHEENLASRKVLEKVGFRQEGVLREHFLVNGIPTNEVYYGILRREWAK